MISRLLHDRLLLRFEITMCDFLPLVKRNTIRLYYKAW